MVLLVLWVCYFTAGKGMDNTTYLTEDALEFLKNFGFKQAGLSGSSLRKKDFKESDHAGEVITFKLYKPKSDFTKFKNINMLPHKEYIDAVANAPVWHGLSGYITDKNGDDKDNTKYYPFSVLFKEQDGKWTISSVEMCSTWNDPTCSYIKTRQIVWAKTKWIIANGRDNEVRKFVGDNIAQFKFVVDTLSEACVDETKCKLLSKNCYQLKSLIKELS
jgi:hypothetical protein